MNQTAAPQSNIPEQKPQIKPDALNKKLQDLEQLLLSYGSVVIACSGGVDSSFLAAVCARCMPQKTLLVHVESALVPAVERRSFEDLCQHLNLESITIKEDAFNNPKVLENTPKRCYFCKFTEFGGIVRISQERGFQTVIDGSNSEDEGDYRPGLKAIAELGVKSPLREARWTKEEERALLRAWNLPVWKQPSSACLASRIPYGEHITPDKIELVSRCENYLADMGFKIIRVRLANYRATIEVGQDERARLFDVSLLDKIDKDFRNFGCKDVYVRICGYTQGSLNSALSAAIIESEKNDSHSAPHK